MSKREEDPFSSSEVVKDPATGESRIIGVYNDVAWEAAEAEAQNKRLQWWPQRPKGPPEEGKSGGKRGRRVRRKNRVSKCVQKKKINKKVELYL